MAGYPFKEIEQKWQDYWEVNKTFRTPLAVDTARPKFYVLDMFPYPSGSGLHVGHPEGYTATDIVARYKRMNGFNVLHPMGWDAFGLPAEQYALATGTHPRITTEQNIDRFRTQLRALGFSYDWDREVSTIDEAYYRWTQWIFLQLFERGLAYEAEVPVNWCPALGTVLANEEVVDGKSERGGYPVIRKPMRQWMLKITAYAERLLNDLEGLEWPENIKEMQRNWIGRSEGAEVDFAVEGLADEVLRVFTTRPDTLWGATYMVLAPEHPLVDRLTTDDLRSTVAAYRRDSERKSDLERTDLQKEKSGVPTGAWAVNPVNRERIPIWVADYVLASYGTGAIMAVPAHDERDWEFARKFDLPIIEVVSGGDVEKEAWTGDGVLVNSSSPWVSIEGLDVPLAKRKITDWLEREGLGRGRVNYKLRDWLFSRQRYWGEPFPVVYVDGRPVALPEDHLPVTLPAVESYQPSGTGESPLALIRDWVETMDPGSGNRAIRETNTMPQWAGSCWYYLRFIDPRNEERLVDPELERYWMPVDLYVGGAEHAVLHLLYARFWHKVLYDAGVVSTQEPFRRLFNQGMILGEVEYTSYRNHAGLSVSADHVDEEGRDRRTGESLLAERVDDSAVEKQGDSFVLIGRPDVRVVSRAFKMSKSRGNVVNPDDVVETYGADSLRLYEMFMGPLDQVKPWSTRGVDGTHRFLSRAYRLVFDSKTGLRRAEVQPAEASADQMRLLHTTIRRVTDDIEGLRFNTAIAALMEFVNAALKWDVVPSDVLEIFALLLSPFAPHLAEEIWSALGHTDTLALENWPVFNPDFLKEESIEIAVQVNGKVRGTVSVPVDAPGEDVLALAKASPNVVRHLEGKTIRKEVYVPGRIVNLVVG